MTELHALHFLQGSTVDAPMKLPREPWFYLNLYARILSPC